MIEHNQQPRSRTFVVMWDCYGLEAVAEVYDPARKAALEAWAILGNKPVPKEISTWSTGNSEQGIILNGIMKSMPLG
jgi:hypothetical protein